MKLVLNVPVEKVILAGGGYTFKFEPREVDVLAVSRSRTGRSHNAHHYYAHHNHPDLHPEYPRIGADGKMDNVWIRRADHPKWKPPVFKDGELIVWIEQKGGE